MKIFPAIVLSGCIALSTLVSCRAIVSVMNDDKVIAQVGKHRLTQSDVRPFIPEGTSPDDSVRIVMRYINVWASEQIFADEAEKRLSKEEKDVTEELEEYRMALLRYRYEQRYINERLDTVITEEEIEEISILQTDIDSYVLQKYAQWIVDGGADAEWDAFQKQLKTMGVDRYIQIYQDACDRYYAEQ